MSARHRSRLLKARKALPMKFVTAAFAIAALLAGHGAAQLATSQPSAPPSSTAPKWVTLGTHGGPVSDPTRAEPANALLIGPDAYLIDAGDGAVGQLAKAGVSVARVKAVFLSHLHFDHVGGLSAVIGLRNQIGAPGVLTIYGPPGTKALVDGLVAATQPSAAAAYGYADRPFADPARSVAVVEMVDGSSAQLGSMTVKARQNSHYSFAPGSDLDKRFKSLSFRFDAPGRSIVYTGDTGPSLAVEQLAAGADLLVSEMIDLDRIITPALRTRLPNDTGQDMASHLTEHHITPDQVGEIAARAKVKALVITHLVSPNANSSDLLGYIATIGRHYSGPVMIANDLDAF